MNDSVKLSIPAGLQILLGDLDFLGQISRGQKMCSTNRVIVDGDTWAGAFYRAWKGENRISTITKIEQIVNQTVDAIDSHKNTDYIGIIVDYFAYARNGVDALKSTYQNDPDMKARINVQLKNIDLQLNQYRHLIRGYAKEVETQLSEKDNSRNNKEQVIVQHEGIDESVQDLSVQDLSEPSIERRHRKHRMKRPDE